MIKRRLSTATFMLACVVLYSGSVNANNPISSCLEAQINCMVQAAIEYEICIDAISVTADWSALDLCVAHALIEGGNNTLKVGRLVRKCYEKHLSEWNDEESKCKNQRESDLRVCDSSSNDCFDAL